MATRADRLAERMRGAQRINVDDDDTFSLDIPGIGGPPIVQEPVPAPVARATPRSAERGDRAGSSSSRSSRGGSSGRKPTRARPGTSSSLPNVPEETTSPRPRPVTAASTRSRRSSAAATSSPAVPAVPQPAESDDRIDGIEPRGTTPRRLRSVSRGEDVVEESPANAPGSGRRRTIPIGTASDLTAKLRDVVIGGSDDQVDSSPTARVVKRKSGGLPARSTRPSMRGSSLRRETGPDDDDELSPETSRISEPDQALAEETNAADAAKVLGRKRPRRSVSRASPEIASGSPDAQEEDNEDDSPPKRRRGRPSKSPVVQKQPAKPKVQAKTKSTRRTSQEAMQRATKTKPLTKSAKAAAKQRKPRGKADQGDDEVNEAADDDNAAIEITVQRFVNLKKPKGGDDDEEDPLHSEIPFANRTGESTVDVFAQVCEEVITNTMGQFHELLSGATTEAAKKKEFRIKMRAIDAYKEELNSRLLQHAIHLDHWHTLRKRLRHVQKEKLTLREDILKLKAEREQVALRMDAIRTKHEADTKEYTYRLDASALMHDIDLVVAQGQKAPELTRKEQKEADLANLELLIAQVTDEASSKSATGGLLSQVTEFNAFLERAAQALESR
ncbi:hypothetical protein CC79DRAFT_1363709 [Sarocladium strictum]